MSGSPARHALRVELGFGAEPLADPESITWTDVSDDVVIPEGAVEAVRWARGRQRAGGTLEPGSASFELEALDGRYDPLNEAGPYYGQLLPGVPVRISVSAQADPVQWFERWFGYVENWPVQLADGAGVLERVTVAAHDVLGLVAQGDAPATAFHAEVAQLEYQPDYWWNPGPDGWTDLIGGLSARHSGGLSEMDPLVDGDERTWGNDDPDGFAEAHGVVLDGDEADPIAVSAWFRFDPERAVEPGTGWTIPNVVVARVDDYVSGLTSTRWSRLFVAVTGDLVSLSATVYPEFEGLGRRRFTSSWLTAEDARLIDGKAHHLFAWMHPISGEAGLWLDGRRVAVELTEQSEDSGYDSWVRTPGPLQIGVGDREASVFARTPYLGAIDHVMIWPAFEQDTDVAQRLPVDLFEAGRLAWAGQLLHERFEALVRGMGAGNLLGTVDTSGIRTAQGYRAAAPLELLSKVEETEQGIVYVDRTGKLCFRSRSWGWQGDDEVTARVRLTDIAALQADPTEPFPDGYWWPLLAGAAIGYDPLAITNSAQVTSEHGRMQVVEDAASVAAVGRRNPVHLSGLLHASDHQSRGVAEWIIRARGEARVRADRVGLHSDEQALAHPSNAALLFNALREVELPQRVHVRLAGRPAVPALGVDAGAPRDLEGHTVGLVESYGWDGWRIHFALTDERAAVSWFTWGSSTWGNTDDEGWAF